MLAYADDIDIIGLRLSYVAEAYQEIEQAAESLRLQINEVKTKLMVETSAGLPTNNQNLRRCDVQIDERTFEVVPQFTYLGSKVSNDNSMEAELRARMLATNRFFYSLRNHFTSNNLSRRTKLGLYSTYIVPVLTYASETWTLSKSDETLLAAFERKMFRRILGPECVERQWRNRYNDELYEMCGDCRAAYKARQAPVGWPCCTHGNGRPSPKNLFRPSIRTKKVVGPN